MIFGLLLMGLLLMAVALKGTEHELGQRLQMDLLGAHGFIVWIFAILAIGAIGYVPGLETTTNYLLALILVVVLIRNGGVWTQLQAAIQQAAFAGPAPAVKPLATSADGGSGGGGGGAQAASGGSSGGDSTASTISTIATVAEIAAIAFSDRRTKENVRFIKTVRGMRVYEFNYVGETKRRRGVMADEVAPSHPHVIGQHAGFLTVDYSGLGKLA